MSAADLCVRAARPSDVERVVEFNLAMAAETEGLELERERLARGVAAVLADARLGAYRVVLDAGELAGCLLVTYEWSDWRDGVFWWIQSVYVAPAARARGAFRALYDDVLACARADRRCCGVRLYVERTNERARAVYEHFGMHATSYRLYEVDFALAR